MPRTGSSDKAPGKAKGTRKIKPMPTISKKDFNKFMKQASKSKIKKVR